MSLYEALANYRSRNYRSRYRLSRHGLRGHVGGIGDLTHKNRHSGLGGYGPRHLCDLVEVVARTPLECPALWRDCLRDSNVAWQESATGWSTSVIEIFRQPYRKVSSGRRSRFQVGQKMLHHRLAGLLDTMLGVWWVSWLGIIGGFLFVGVSEVKIKLSRGAISRPSLILLMAIPALWICFFIADSKVIKRTPTVVRMLTVAGTLLAALTLVGTWFFVANAGRG